jgi:hypothetical protein
MSTQFHRVLAVALPWSFALAPSASIAQQNVNRGSASVTISPSEATIHLGEKQTFEAMVKGTQSTGVQWSVVERNGGQITEDGVYTAPRHVGLYHVVATSEENHSAKAVAKVKVVTEYDTPDSQKLR